MIARKGVKIVLIIAGIPLDDAPRRKLGAYLVGLRLPIQFQAPDYGAFNSADVLCTVSATRPAVVCAIVTYFFFVRSIPWGLRHLWKLHTRALDMQRGLIQRVHCCDERIVFGYDTTFDRQSNAYPRGFRGSKAVDNYLGIAMIELMTERNHCRDQ